MKDKPMNDEALNEYFYAHNCYNADRRILHTMKNLWNEALEFAAKNAVADVCGNTTNHCCIKTETILTHKYPEL